MCTAPQPRYGVLITSTEYWLVLVQHANRMAGPTRPATRCPPNQKLWGGCKHAECGKHGACKLFASTAGGIKVVNVFFLKQVCTCWIHLAVLLDLAYTSVRSYHHVSVEYSFLDLHDIILVRRWPRSSRLRDQTWRRCHHET